MKSTSIATHCKNPLVSFAAIVIILAGISYAENIISPLLIALFISALSGPAMFWLTEKKVPQGLAVTFIIACIIILGFFISSILGSSVHGFSDNLPEYQKRLQEITHSAGQTLMHFGINIQLAELKNIFNLGKAMGLISTTLNQLLAALSNIFFILMVVIFLLLELNSFRFKIKAISADPEQTMEHLYHVSKTVANYFKIKALTSFLTALSVFIVLTIMEIDFPILWAMMAF
ncbi:MAG: AI-2E family transporter, partial [Gammaproteobacteria bacterium]|nr:AI-2E family transporter [Gammaproteobacteria bacterium]